MPRKIAKPSDADAPITPKFDIASLREAKVYLWREIDRGEHHPPLRVRLLDLNVREAESIPFTTRTPLRDVMPAIAPFVTDWDLEAEDLTTGKTIPVPAPGSPEATELMGAGNEGELFTVLDDSTVSLIALWLKNPGAMELQEKGKKSKRSESTATPSESAAAE